MFTYLISPSDKQRPLLIALSFVDDTITGYFTPMKKLTLSEFVIPDESSFTKFGYCSSQVKDKYNIGFSQSDDNEHSKLHSADHRETTKLGEKHSHMKFPKKLSSSMLKQFFQDFTQCEKIQKLERNNVIFSKKVIKDIIEKFKKYENNNYKDMFASNNPCYEKYTPTIYDHYQCLDALDMNNEVGCLPPTPSQACLDFVNNNSMLAYTQASYPELYPQVSYAKVMAQTVGTIALAGLATFGLFTLCNAGDTTPTNTNTNQTNSVTTSKQKSKKRR